MENRRCHAILDIAVPVLTAYLWAGDAVRSPCPSFGLGKTPPAAVFVLPPPLVVVGMAC